MTALKLTMLIILIFPDINYLSDLAILRLKAYKMNNHICWKEEVIFIIKGKNCKLLKWEKKKEWWELQRRKEIGKGNENEGVLKKEISDRCSQIF